MILLHTASLVLEDNTVFRGYSSFPKEGAYPGEVVFTTAMSGYQEVCTDPSYFGQIVVFTNPHIGNTGINDHDNESERAWLSGIVVNEPHTVGHHLQKKENLSSFLERDSVPSLFGVDTRRLAHHLRKNGTQHGALVIGGSPLQPIFPYSRPSDPIGHVTTPHTYTLNKEIPSPHICVLDFGMKRSLLRQLTRFYCKATVCPAWTSFQEILRLKPNGIVLSSGPGDPEQATEARNIVDQLLQANLPLLGICFGCQLLGLATGGKTHKLPYGHHSTNHPVLERSTKKAFSTSQNHNFALQESSLPPSVEITHHSLLDDSVEGILLKHHPIIGVQFHPEGGPGPQDCSNCFADFFSLVHNHAQRSFS